MDPAGWALVLGAGATALGSLASAIKAASSAYQEAIAREAARLEAKRMADQCAATVAAKNAEIDDLKAENARLWSMIGGKDG
jgi:phage host-nuclease inhibitor protein Gam